jgi:hypothetical protein
LFFSAKTTIPDAGDNGSEKANILDLVTLPATPAGINFVRPPVSAASRGSGREAFLV